MRIAEYILSIFKHYTTTVWSWGFHNPVAIEECEEGEGGLMFNVEGFNFKGQVKVMLNWMDTFDIYLIKDGMVIEALNDIYVDSLVDVIDQKVEFTPDYKQRVKKEYGIARA